MLWGTYVVLLGPHWYINHEHVYYVDTIAAKWRCSTTPSEWNRSLTKEMKKEKQFDSVWCSCPSPHNVTQEIRGFYILHACVQHLCILPVLSILVCKTAVYSVVMNVFGFREWLLWTPVFTVAVPARPVSRTLIKKEEKTNMSAVAVAQWNKHRLHLYYNQGLHFLTAAADSSRG